MDQWRKILLKIFIYYLLIINAAAFAFYGIDKRKAVRQRWRIRESVLLGLAAAGGSVGAPCGMKLFHHKTHKRRFSIGVPAMLIAWTAALIYIMYRIYF